MVSVSALATTLFLGGYHALPGLGFTETWLGGWFTLVWFFAKVILFFFLFVWLRGTLPRLRYDQFMQFGWKVLIPVSLLWIMVVSTLRVMAQQGASRTVIIAFTFGILLLIFAAASLFERSKERIKKESAQSLKAFPTPSFPVPSLTASLTNGTEEIHD